MWVKKEGTYGGVEERRVRKGGEGYLRGGELGVPWHSFMVQSVGDESDI